MKRLFCLLLTLALVVGLVPAARAEAALLQVLTGQTKALKPGSTSESIYAKISGVITAGTSGKTFSPDDPCTRGQVVTFLWRTMDQPQPAGEKNPFRDAKTEAFYYQAMLWAVGEGITTGTGKDTFSPADPCTRGQVVTFLYRTLNESKKQPPERAAAFLVENRRAGISSPPVIFFGK